MQLHLKINHKSRIIISNRYKMMINSPEVHLGIKRSHAEVENKNIVLLHKSFEQI
jgi:hypothetical protein